jgi:TonB family protein
MPVNYYDTTEDRQQLFRSAETAVLVEIGFFLLLGLLHLPVFHGSQDVSRYVDVQILQLPANAHLTGAEAVNASDEVYFNPKRKHRPAPEKKKQEAPKAEEQNQVNAGPLMGPTHGPVALYSPAPAIPDYLRNQYLKASVVIEFLITAGGEVTARLLDSSGNDELDAIALATVKKWQFKPAAKDNVPIDSKTRLRINFEVY